MRPSEYFKNSHLFCQMHSSVNNPNAQDVVVLECNLDEQFAVLQHTHILQTHAWSYFTVHMYVTQYQYGSLDGSVFTGAAGQARERSMTLTRFKSWCC